MRSLDLPTSFHYISTQKQLKGIALRDNKNRQNIELNANNFRWANQVIVNFYEAQWEIEVFLRNIKIINYKNLVGLIRMLSWIRFGQHLLLYQWLKIWKIRQGTDGIYPTLPLLPSSIYLWRQNYKSGFTDHLEIAKNIKSWYGGSIMI